MQFPADKCQQGYGLTFRIKEMLYALGFKAEAHRNPRTLNCRVREFNRDFLKGTKYSEFFLPL